MKQYSSELRSGRPVLADTGSAGGGNSVAYAAFQARMSNRSVTTLAGIGTSWSKMARISGLSSWLAVPAGAGSGISASRNRCWRSTGSSRSVLATASSTWTLARIGRPCSSQVYQVTPTPASCATSSRRSPAVRLRCPPGSPTSSGVIRSRRLRKNAASSLRRRVTAFPFSLIAPS